MFAKTTTRIKTATELKAADQSDWRDLLSRNLAESRLLARADALDELRRRTKEYEARTSLPAR